MDTDDLASAPRATQAPTVAHRIDRRADGGGVDVSGYVRRVRRLADLSQRELAARLDVSQTSVSRVERDGRADVETFARILGVAGLRLCVVDDAGTVVSPMPADVFRDGAGRRLPAHLDVHAVPEPPTPRMLLHAVDPVPDGGVWHHLRRERDRIRAVSGACAHDEQLTAGAARERRYGNRLGTNDGRRRQDGRVTS